MNISAYILEYLKQFGSVEVPQFGVFFLETSKAVLNAETGSILPPSTQIAFRPDYQNSSNQFLEYISSQRSVSNEMVKNELQIQTDFWKKKLQAEHFLEIENVGRVFYEDKHLIFKGNRFEADFPDFYGLEEIKFSDIHDTDSPIDTKNKEGDYKLNKSILWIFLFVVPVGALAYLGITQQELIFGKKSFDSVSVQTKTKRIEPVVPIKIDSALIKKSDSIKLDSLKKDSILKKNTPKKYKPKSKWHK